MPPCGFGALAAVAPRLAVVNTKIFLKFRARFFGRFATLGIESCAL
jgi:hypothetical protein